MLTKDDLQAIKEIIGTNNNVLGTIFKIELTSTRKEFSKEMEKTEQRLTKKIEEKNTILKQINELKERLATLEKRSIQN